MRQLGGATTEGEYSGGGEQRGRQMPGNSLNVGGRTKCVLTAFKD